MVDNYSIQESQKELDTFNFKNYKYREGRKISDFYRMSKMLGAGRYDSDLLLFLGSYGDVWMCVQRETGAHRALKVIRKSQFLEMEEAEKKRAAKKKEEEDKSSS